MIGFQRIDVVNLIIIIIIYYENRAQSTNLINTTIITPKACRTRKPKAKLKLEETLLQYYIKYGKHIIITILTDY